MRAPISETVYPDIHFRLPVCVLPRDHQPEGLEALLYELLDAHADTAQLVYESAPAEAWEAHLAYLRDLQRVGRETLAGRGAGR